MVYSKDVQKSRFVPKNPHKYVGDVTKIICRSSYERKFCIWCDMSENVLQWGSEEIVVPYQSPLDHRAHRYFVDFFIKVRTKSGAVKRHLIEVKPLRFTLPPVQGKRKSKRFLEEVMQYGVNQAKWKAARQFAKQIGAEFSIITEHDLGIGNTS